MTQTSKQGYIGWAICTAFFFFQYILRVIPDIISKELFTSFKMSVTEFGTLSSIYSITYGLMQIPIGILLDRIGVKKVAMLSFGLFTLGALLFCTINNLYTLYIARFITALGSASSFCMTLKLLSIYTKGTTFTVLAGITSSIGVLGPICCSHLLEAIGLENWHYVVYILVLVGPILAGSLLLTNIESHTKSNSLLFDWDSVKAVALYVIISSSTYLPIAVEGIIQRFIKKHITLLK